MIRSRAPSGRAPAPPLRSVAILGAVLAWLLAGCSPAEEAHVHLASLAPMRGPSVIAATAAATRFSADHFIAADGESLPLRKWLPKAPPKAVILALHGFNDYGNAFGAPAALWAERGIATFAYDQRGFGGARGHYVWAGAPQLAADAVSASRVLRSLYPRTPIYLLGESMGGAVAVVAMTGAAGTPRPDVDGVILSAPAVWGRDTMELLPKLALWAGVRMFPAMTLTGKDLGVMPSDNLPMLRALARDPLIIKATRVDAIYGLVNLMDRALAAAPRLDAPTLIMYGAHDEVVPRLPMTSFVAHLPPDPDHARRLAYYPEGYHMLLRDLEGPMVAADVAQWVLDSKAPLPSHSDITESARPWPPHGETG